MKHKLLLFLFFLVCICTHAQTTIATNSCAEIEEGSIYACSWGGIFWAKTYNLQDYGINTNQEFIVNYGEIGLSEVGTWDVNIRFNIYEIDSNFPTSFSENNLIGSSQVIPVLYFGSWNPQIISANFDSPILIPADVEMILVEVEQLDSLSSGAIAFAANMTNSDGSLSWFRSGNPGCPPSVYESTTDMGYTDANFHIAISGIIDDTVAPFTLNYTRNCSQTDKAFFLNNTDDIASVLWDFGDPASGSNNTSTLLSPTHDFSAPGNYTVSVIITQIDGTTYTINENITVAEPPVAHPIEDIYSCEDTQGTGISSNFDTSFIEEQLLGGQSGVTVSYFDQNGNQLPSPLPNPFTNTQQNVQEITARISYSNDLCCYSETTFSMIVNPKPEIPQLENVFACDPDEDGFTNFNLNDIADDLLNNQTEVSLTFYDSNTNLIETDEYDSFMNLTPGQDVINVILTNEQSNCISETQVSLNIENNPVAHEVETIYACDDNGDGISEYFNTSTIEAQVLNEQTGLEVSYYDQSGNLLPSPLPNPYTNSVPFSEIITLRVTDPNTSCYSEIALELETSTQPVVSQPDNLYACDQGNGFSSFNTSNLEQQLIGNQTGLDISYYDENFNPLPSPLPVNFQNVNPFQETINIKIEDVTNPECYTETSVNLIVNALPDIEIDENYFICALDPYKTLNVSDNFNTYEWTFEDGNILSETNSTVITEEGDYNLKVSQIENGIECERNFEFSLTRSQLPEIEGINHGSLGNNFIEIIAIGDGDFEYSIDGVNYQDSNYFSNLLGGNYSVFVRDKYGCGEDVKRVAIVDYPQFFTPNGDGINDFWHVNGINEVPGAEVMIFDRYGKFLIKLNSFGQGWDGTYNGKQMSSNEYWFRATLKNGEKFSGHFSLIR